MSLSLSLTKTIDEVIQTFIKKVSDKYNLNNNELVSIWKGESNIKESKTDKTEHIEEKKKSNEISQDVLLNCNKAELIALCKANGHKCSGSKIILINRLLGKDENESPNKSIKSESKVNKVSAIKSTPIAKKLTANIPNILIRRNQFNNYEHPETGLVFNNETKVVIGKQNGDGSIDHLTAEDIDKCNAFKFKFDIPTNLDHKSTLKEVKVDELSEDEDDELQVEEDEIDEEDIEEEELLEDEEEFEEYVTDED